LTTPPDNKVTFLRPAHAKSALQRERARIVEAAIDEIGYSGPLLFAMERVADRCNLSAETIKQHFNERQALIEAVGTTVSQILVDACIEQMSSQKSGADRLLGIIKCHFDENISPKRLVAVWVLFYGATSQHSNYEEVFSDADDRIFSMIRRCVGEILKLHPDDPEVLDLANAIYSGTRKRSPSITRVVLSRLKTYSQNSYQPHLLLTRRQHRQGQNSYWITWVPTTQTRKASTSSSKNLLISSMSQTPKRLIKFNFVAPLESMRARSVKMVEPGTI